MLHEQELKENTRLMDKYFPFNIFHNNSDHHNILSLHWHDNLEIIYMTQGHAIFYIGNQPFPAIPEDILFVNSKQLHAGYSVDNTHVDYYAIVFHKSLLSSNVPDPLLEYISPLMEGQLLLPNKVDSKSELYKIIQTYILKIIEEFNHKKPGYELVIKSFLYLIIISILRDTTHASDNRNTQNNYERQMERFNKLMAYIEEHFPEKISVKQAASIINLSPHHFCKTFKKVTGRTFVEFLNLYRINKAEELLRNTSLTITEIAERVGFCNINYFSRTFKEYKRYSPSQCRKSAYRSQAEL